MTPARRGKPGAPRQQDIFFQTSLYPFRLGNSSELHGFARRFSIPVIETNSNVLKRNISHSGTVRNGEPRNRSRAPVSRLQRKKGAIILQAYELHNAFVRRCIRPSRSWLFGGSDGHEPARPAIAAAGFNCRT